jgi:hypothetical protein
MTHFLNNISFVENVLIAHYCSIRHRRSHSKEPITMTKSRRMQVMVTEKLAATIADYQAEHNVSQSRACQDSFITAALNELLQSSYATQALLNMTADKVLEKSHDKNNQPYAAKPLIKKSHQLAERAVTNLIHGLPEDP